MEVFKEIQGNNNSKSAFSLNSFQQVLPVTHSANKGSIRDLDTSMKYILDQIENIKQQVEKDKFDCFIQKTMLVKSDKENSLHNFSKKGTDRDIKFSKNTKLRFKKKIQTHIHLQFNEEKKDQLKGKERIKTFTFLNPISSSKIDQLPYKIVPAQIQIQDSNSDCNELTRGRACSFFHPLLATPLKIEDFSLGQLIGSGKFGDVHLCEHKQTKWLFALKKILKSTIIQYKMMTQFTNQLKIQYKLDHPNIVKLYAHFSDEYHIFLIMEYIPGGNLFEKIKSSQGYVSNVLQQSLEAIDYIHKNNIIHRDIKPQNIVQCFGDTVKLCDFGLSAYLTPQYDVRTSFCGTLDYIAPEMKDVGVYDYSIDIWGLGVLTYELLIGQAPFKDQITNWKKRGGKRNSNWNWTIRYPQTTSEKAVSFMKNLLKADPHQRISIQAALSSNFIKGNSKNKCQIFEKQARNLGLCPL